jgi:hypothetical protein
VGVAGDHVCQAELASRMLVRRVVLPKAPAIDPAVI